MGEVDAVLEEVKEGWELGLWKDLTRRGLDTTWTRVGQCAVLGGRRKDTTSRTLMTTVAMG